MGLTVGSRNIADTRIQGVTLRPLVGCYELIFGLYLNIHADETVLRRGGAPASPPNRSAYTQSRKALPGGQSRENAVHLRWV